MQPGVRPGDITLPGPAPSALHFLSVAHELPALAVRLRAAPAALAVLLLLLGLAALTLGSRFFRVLAVLGGAALGAGIAWFLAPGIQGSSGMPPWLAVSIGTLLLGALSALWPLAFVFALGAWPGAVLGVRLAAGHATP